MNPLVSVCIPTFYNPKVGLRILNETIESINRQNMNEVEICIGVQSDLQTNNQYDSIKSRFSLVVGFGDGKGPADNTNFAMSLATGKYIKILNHDDMFGRPNALEEMFEALDLHSNKKWLVSACCHTDKSGKIRERPHAAVFPGEKALVEGANYIGCPSVLMFNRELSLQCDPNVLYAMDCSMYIDLYRMAGLPIVADNADNIVIRMWDSQLTNNLNIPHQLELDKAVMRKKYGYT